MKYDVLNRFTGRVKFTAEIDCHESAPRSLKLRLAVLWAIENETDLRDSDLSYSDLRGSDLSGSNLSGSNLRGSRGISNKAIDGGIRSDGYRFLLVLSDGVRRVQAGCRNFPYTEGVEHWQETRTDTPLGDETFAILEHMKRIADLRGWDDK